MLTFFHVLAARVRAFFSRGRLDREFAEELESHLAMAEEEKIRQGKSPEEARREAHLELGGLTQLREAGREARGLPHLDTFWLDIKLGFRMLRKSWGLTLVGGVAMTIVMGIGVVVFAVADLQFRPTLPLDEGEAVVALQTWDEVSDRRHPTSLEDLERWRDVPRSLEDVGTFQTVEKSLVPGKGFEEPAIAGRTTETVAVAEMSASGFRVARVDPLIGRTLIEEDERDGAVPVVVIGHDVWLSRFSADRDVLGRFVRLGDTIHTVVGVMPEGFAFPINHHFWTASRANGGEVVRDAGEEGVVFARLAPGSTMESAQAELTTLGLLAVPEANQELHPRVVPYTFAFSGDFKRDEVRWFIRIILVVGALLLVPPCANIAILVYARTVTRQGEFAARFALGASRGRIIAQLFIEMLVLSAVAAAMALVFARLALERLEGTVNRAMNDGAPFWMDFTLSFETLLFAAGLAVVAALLSALVPALKATGRQMQSGLNALGSRMSVRLGATWTTLVVAQIALTLATLPSAVEMGWGTIRQGVLGPGFAAEEYLTAKIGVDREVVGSTMVEGDERPVAARFEALRTDLTGRLEAEPGVLGVSFAAAVPGDEPWLDVEVEGVRRPEDSIISTNSLVRVNRVDIEFFDLFDVPILTGRGFEASDIGSDRPTVIVDQTFVEQLLGDESPLGRRVRYVRRTDDRRPQPWHEVVGVVADIPANEGRGKIYHPMVPGEAHPLTVVLRVGGGAAVAAGRLREIAMSLDPALRIDEILPLDQIYRDQQVGNNIGASSIAAVTLSVLLLSAAGIYALMAFTVSQRRREIGIRAALGAQPIRLLAGVLRGALTQIAIGAVIGVGVALLVDYYLPIELVGGWSVPGVIPAAAVLMLGIGLIATAGSARRALQVEPMDELREG